MSNPTPAQVRHLRHLAETGDLRAPEPTVFALRIHGLIEPYPGGYALTEAGREAAARADDAAR